MHSCIQSGLCFLSSAFFYFYLFLYPYFVLVERPLRWGSISFFLVKKISLFFLAVCFFLKVNAGLPLPWKNCGIKMTHGGGVGGGGGVDLNPWKARTRVLLQICMLSVFFLFFSDNSSHPSHSVSFGAAAADAPAVKNGSSSSPSRTNISTLSWTLLKMTHIRLLFWFFFVAFFLFFNFTAVMDDFKNESLS